MLFEDVFTKKDNRGGKLKGIYTPQTLLIIEELKKMSAGGFLPHGALEEIGAKFDLSRERIRQIATRAKIPTYRDHVAEFTEPCVVCQEAVHIKPGRARAHRKVFCDKPVCRMIYTAVINKRIMKCEQCKKEKMVNKSRRRDKTIQGEQRFCDKVCYGKWFAARYGFQKGHTIRHTNHKRGGTFYTREWFEENLPKYFTLSDLQKKRLITKGAGYNSLGKATRQGILTSYMQGGTRVLHNS